MTLKGAAFLALWNDFDPGRDAEYNRWHTFEHVPERVGIEGILAGRRYAARERSERRYFTLYELAGLAALDGPQYADVVDRPTAWSAAMRPSFRNFLRSPCATVLTTGLGMAGSIVTFRFGVAQEPDASAVKAALEPLLESPESPRCIWGAWTPRRSFRCLTRRRPGAAPARCTTSCWSRDSTGPNWSAQRRGSAMRSRVASARFRPSRGKGTSSRS
jgi:hypothetical protein